MPIHEFDLPLEYFDVRFVVNSGSIDFADGRCRDLSLHMAMYQRVTSRNSSNEPAEATTTEQHHDGRRHCGKGTEVRRRCLTTGMQVMRLENCTAVLESMLSAIPEVKVIGSLCSLQSMINAGRHVLQGHWRCDAR